MLFLPFKKNKEVGVFRPIRRKESFGRSAKPQKIKETADNGEHQDTISVPDLKHLLYFVPQASMKRVIIFVGSILSLCRSSRVPGETAVWDLEREECFAGVFRNNATTNRFGNLFINSTSKTECLYGRGVQAKSTLASASQLLIQSQKSMQELVDANPYAFTVELWGDFGSKPSEADQLMPIFTIGEGSQNETNSPYCSVDVSDIAINMVIGSENQKLTVSFVDIFGLSVQSTGTYLSSDGISFLKSFCL